MDIKSKIIEILQKENYTFPQLAEYLHMTEDGLTTELNNKTLELRNLEAISKALKVPLYSFFRADGIRFDSTLHPFHTNKMWMGDDDIKTVEQLEVEIKLLTQIIHLKENQINKLKAK
jgi:transcriptional regulator with XRE-family HTH domain